MPGTDQTTVLALRVAGERARMDDLLHLLPFATAGGDDSRGRNLAARVAGRTGRLTGLEERDDAWAQWQESAEDGDLLVDEVVALLMTRLLRTQRLDSGTFDAAEALLAELATRADVPPVVLGQTQELESVDHTRASVALRFPGSRVWDLPFLAHEFGHYAVAELAHIDPALKKRRPLDDVAVAVAGVLSEARQPSDQARSHAHELIADAVATVSCGPVYPVACLCLRVPAAPRASTPTATHPAWSDRVATMRAVLEALSDRTGLPRYRARLASDVDPLVVALLGQLPPTPPAAAEVADRTVAVILKHRGDLLYRQGDDAIAEADSLGQQPRPALPPAQATVAAVIDGAWQWRLTKPSDPDQDDAVAALVVQHCCSIMNGGARDRVAGDHDP